MIEEDTIKLLRECDVGIKMGVSSLEEVGEYASSDNLKRLLTENKIEHEKLKEEIEALLHQYHDQGKKPNPIVQGMSTIKTNMELMMNDSDYKIADILTDGCNMGIKSLSRYLNQYKAASEEAKDITKKLIKLEEKLSISLRDYL